MAPGGFPCVRGFSRLDQTLAHSAHRHRSGSGRFRDLPSHIGPVLQFTGFAVEPARSHNAVFWAASDNSLSGSSMLLVTFIHHSFHKVSELRCCDKTVHYKSIQTTVLIYLARIKVPVHIPDVMGL